MIFVTFVLKYDGQTGCNFLNFHELKTSSKHMLFHYSMADNGTGDRVGPTGAGDSRGEASGGPTPYEPRKLVPFIRECEAFKLNMKSHLAKYGFEYHDVSTT